MKIVTDTELKQKGYGTIGSQELQGQTLNVDNYWRKDNSESEGFDWFGLAPNTQAYWQNGFKVHYEDYYQPQNRTPFSPLPDNLFSQEGAFVGILLFWLAKNKPDIFKDLAKTYITSWSNLLKTVMEVGKASPYTAIHQSTVFAALAHRAGLINDGGYLKIVDEARNVISVMQQLAATGKVLEGVQTFVEGSKSTAGQYGISKQGLALLANTKAAAP